MKPARLLNPRSRGVHSLHVRSWILSSRTRPREGWRFLTMRLATMAESIIAAFSTLEILYD